LKDQSLGWDYGHTRGVKVERVGKVAIYRRGELQPAFLSDRDENSDGGGPP
jgi:hypothetical protein